MMETPIRTACGNSAEDGMYPLTDDEAALAAVVRDFVHCEVPPAMAELDHPNANREKRAEQNRTAR